MTPPLDGLVMRESTCSVPTSSDLLSTSLCPSRCILPQNSHLALFMAEYVYALHDFVPEHDDEVPFRAGERIQIVERDDLYGDGWWQVSSCSLNFPTCVGRLLRGLPYFHWRSSASCQFSPFYAVLPTALH